MVRKDHFPRFHRDEDEVRPPIRPIQGILVENDPPTGKMAKVTDNLSIIIFLHKLTSEEERGTCHRQYLIHLEMLPLVSWTWQICFYISFCRNAINS